MGFLDFLKAKKGQKKEEFESSANFEQLPPLSTENELYSELPNLPEAPETPGLPEIELPPPLKGLGDFDFPEGMGGETGKKPALAETPEANAQYNPNRYKPSEEQLIPKWPKAAELKLPELPAPELKMPEPHPDAWSGLISHRNNFFLTAEDFRMIENSIDAIIRIQKKHHRLTDIKKEENSHYEHVSFAIEEMQRKLMHVDRTLFE